MKASLPIASLSSIRLPGARLGLLLAFLVPTSAHAQSAQIESAGLLPESASRLLEIVNDPTTLRLPAASVFPADSVVHGSAVGTLTVISRHVPDTYASRAGGEAPSASVGRMGTRPRGPSSTFAFDLPGYNRIEGLPIQLGPQVRGGGANPLRASALLVVRTAGDRPFGQERLGYRVEIEQSLWGDGTLSVGAGVHSLVTPIETQGLGDWENGSSALLLTSDHRDYFERSGERAFLRWAPGTLPVTAAVEFRQEELGLVAPADPWTVFGGGDPWRLQPITAEGSTRAVVGLLEFDNRFGGQDPRGGWWIRAAWREGTGGDLTYPLLFLGPDSVEEDGAISLPSARDRGSDVLVDLRRYEAVGESSTLNLRVLMAGSPIDRPLPAQQQRILGGIGSLPGYPSFAADCGAREGVVRVERGEETRLMYPAYGCDRVALFQVEYRGGLASWSGFGEEAGGAEHPGRGRAPGLRWAVFFDAGRGWSFGGAEPFARVANPTLYDAGVGLLFENAGVYWAVPVGEGRSQGGRLHLRMERRF